jgi:hypothetical protein
MKQINYSVVENTSKESPYNALIKALEDNPDKMIQIRCSNTKNQQLALLQWLRRHEVKSMYYTRIIDRQLYLGKNNEAT